VPPLRISIVEYLNTAPLVRGFTHGPLQGKYELSFTVPSQCAEALRAGAVDVAIIPAIEYQRIDNLAVLPNLAIASKKSVRSLLLVSKKPIEEVTRIALDRSSRSTQALTRILCEKLWHIRPEFFEAAPDLPAMLQQAELNLQYTKIVAPVSGEINKTVVVGLNVEPGQQLLTVVPLDEVWVTANFKETQLKHMQVGQKADIHVDSSGTTLHGHVDSIAGATGPLFSLLPPENATGNYVKIVQRLPVKIVLESGENRDRRLRPGMNVVPDVYLR